MKIYNNIEPERMATIKQIASSNGLEALDFNKPYKLYKIGSKTKDGGIKIQEQDLVAGGLIQLVGTENSMCLLLLGAVNWFRTSEVLSCKKNESGFIIETLNSFYELRED
jgi:hypothetical protein